MYLIHKYEINYEKMTILFICLIGRYATEFNTWLTQRSDRPFVLNFKSKLLKLVKSHIIKNVYLDGSDIRFLPIELT